MERNYVIVRTQSGENKICTWAEYFILFQVVLPSDCRMTLEEAKAVLNLTGGSDVRRFC